MLQKWLDITSFEISKKLWEMGYGTTETERLLYPLHRYIVTARIPTGYLKALNSLSQKGYTAIAKKLAKGGPDDAVVDRIRAYLAGKATK